MFGIALQSRRSRSRGLPHSRGNHRRLAIERLESRHLLSATFYVDVDGLGGTPSDANSGTIDHPLKTIQEAIERASPGDTILIRGGLYDAANGNGALCFNNGGLPGEPLTIEAYPGEQPIIDLGQYYHPSFRTSGFYYLRISGAAEGQR